MSAVERAEWLQLLDEMSDQQINDLMDILKPAAQSAPQAAKPVLPKSAAPFSMPKVDITEKEISTSKPFFEPEIAAHAGMQTPRPTAPQPLNPPPTPAPVDPSILQKKVENLAKQMAPIKPAQQAIRPAPAQPLQTQAAPPPRQEQQPHHQPLQPLDPAETIALRSSEDFARLTAAHLHGADPKEELQKVYDSMVVISKNSDIYEIISNFEKSPLYKTYIEMGIELLNNQDADRQQAYETVESSMQKSRKEFLTKEEFEAFADFRNKIEDLM